MIFDPKKYKTLNSFWSFQEFDSSKILLNLLPV